MKCHYEVLSLERDCEESQIKSAYRKAALRYHPDKNLDDPAGAKVLFQQIQQAYEVLSDPQERAWYDRHREQILRGSGSEYEDNSLNVYQYFTATCYSGFGDDDKGFYAVYRTVFEQLASEEVEYLDSEAEFEGIPKFGDSTSDYEHVVHPFYAYWQSFCTKKSYAWLSTHNITEIRDRRILKVVEKEHKKVQQKARKERNEEIRSLVSFVRKRDKRVQAQRKLLEARAAENRKRQAQSDLEQVMRRKQELAEQMKSQKGSFLDEGYEEQLRQLEKGMQSSDEELEVDLIGEQLQDIHIDMNDLNLNVDCDEFFCVACNKTFRHQSSYRNHESSKKHKENVERIKLEMLEEDGELLSNDDEVGEKESADESPDLKGEASISEEEEIIKSASSTTTTSNKKKKKQRGPVLNGRSSLVDPEEDDETNVFLKQSKAHSDDDDDDWEASTSKAKKSKPKPGNNKMDKKAKPANLMEKPTEVIRDNLDEKPAATVDVDHKCVTCKEEFSSKNRLFTHLKKTNHGVYIPKGKVVTETDLPELRKGGKGKRRN